MTEAHPVRLLRLLSPGCAIVAEGLSNLWSPGSGSQGQALGVIVLLMPTLMGYLRKREVIEALEMVSMVDVESWNKKTFRLTFSQEKRSPIKKSRHENLREAIH